MFISFCLSLWGLLLYSITYVNSVVVYICNRKDIFTFRCCICHLCSIQNGIGHCELIQMTDIEWPVFQWTKGTNRFYGKGPHPLLWAASLPVTRGKIKVMSVTSWFMPSGWRPRPLTKLHVKPVTWYRQLSCNFCCCVIICAVQMCHGATCES